MTPTIPNTQRFFVPATALEGGQALVIDPGLVHQIAAVLRLRAGERVLLLDGSGFEYTVLLTAVERKQVIGTVESRAQGKGEPRTQITLYLALLRGERFEWVLQKGTELGVAAFVPLQCQRGLPVQPGHERKIERWRRIIREAAEQSCRARLPTLAAPLSFDAACTQAAAAGPAFLLYEGTAQPLRDALARLQTTEQWPAQALALLSGPEGGIAEKELTSAQHHGIISVSLGPRILRAETAPIAATSALLFALGEL
jgi:16S rRNA (uracil1498-N3)-methyltransferase